MKITDTGGLNLGTSTPLALGANNLTLTGSIGATGARATKVWATDIESTNAPTVGGTAVLVSGGALGTPSSGTVTNLTGTASININGTVGATTPTTVKGTTVDATTGFLLNGAATSNKILKGNGTNIVLSTETYAAPGTSGNVMTSDGTNWTSAAPAGGATFKTGQASYAAGLGSGDLTIAHGVGSTPSMIVIHAMAQSTGNNANCTSVGTATSTTTDTCTYTWWTHNVLGGVGQNSAEIVHTEGSAGSGSDGWSGVLSALNSTNIVITLSKTGAPGTCYVQWEAYK